MFSFVRSTGLLVMFNFPYHPAEYFLFLRPEI
jgi:hypothetical protein